MKDDLKHRLPNILFAVPLIAMFVSPAPALAHSCAIGIVKERMAVMNSIGKAMKSISKMARGKAPLNSKKVVEAAVEIGNHGKRITELFPEGSSYGVSEASPNIWKDWNGFRNRADRLVAAAGDLALAGSAGDASKIKSAYRALGKSCGGCHKQFRIKTNKSKHGS